LLSSPATIASAITPQPMNDKRAPFKASDRIIFHFSFDISHSPLFDISHLPLPKHSLPALIPPLLFGKGTCAPHGRTSPLSKHCEIVAPPSATGIKDKFQRWHMKNVK
jgi:hypothetical protein